MGCDCGRLREENRRLRAQLRGFGDGLDDDDGEDISDMSDWDGEEEPSRWDEPSRDGRLDPAHMVGGPGSGHPANATKEFRRYSRQTARGETYGSDVARFMQGKTIEAESPIDRGMQAVSRFNKSRLC